MVLHDYGTCSGMIGRIRGLDVTKESSGMEVAKQHE